MRGKGKKVLDDDDEIPFIFDYDLYTKWENELPAEDIAAIALTLYVTLGTQYERDLLWAQNALIQGISRWEP